MKMVSRQLFSNDSNEFQAARLAKEMADMKQKVRRLDCLLEVPYIHNMALFCQALPRERGRRRIQ